MSDPLAARMLEPQALAHSVALLLLLLARLAPLAWLVPWATVRSAPPAVAIATISVLALCLWPAAANSASTLPLSALPLLLLALREALIGVVYALALSLPLRALEWAGLLAGRFMVAPGTDTTLGSLQLLLGVSAFFALGGHRLAIAALADGVVRRPIGASSPLHDLSGVALGSARLLGDAFASALLIALPMAAVLVLTDLGVALAARSASSSGLSAALAPSRAALALLVLWVSTLLLLGSLPELFARGLQAGRRLWETL